MSLLTGAKKAKFPWWAGLTANDVESVDGANRQRCRTGGVGLNRQICRIDGRGKQAAM